MDTYYINGMHCNGCVRRATKFIMEIPGIKSVNINLISSKTILNTEREISFEEVSRVVTSAGYELTTQAPSFSYVFSMWFKKYMPLIVAFSVVILWTTVHRIISSWSLHYAMHDFMGAFFLLFGGLKIFNWKKFAESFQGYDPLAMKFPIYSYLYPALEVFLGFAYMFRFGEELPWNILTILILGITTIGVIKVLNRGEMVKCACLGGYFNIPITWFTVFENCLMIFMAIYMQIFFGSI